MNRKESSNHYITALYCRLSRDDGNTNESMSIQSQKVLLREYAEKHGFLSCAYYVDDGYSGTNFQRPDFQRMIQDIRDGKIGTIITKDLSRLGRNYLETGTYIEIFFPNHGVRYIAVNDNVDSANHEQMDITPFRNIINEFYAKDISMKVRSAMRARARAGKYMATTPPFGYNKDPADHNHLVIDEQTAPVVRRIFDYALQGMGLHRIAMRLYEDKEPRPCSYKPELFQSVNLEGRLYDWPNSYIDMILKSPTYAGHLEIAKRPTHSMKSHKRMYVPMGQREIVRNTHEPIIPQDEWDAVQRILKSRPPVMQESPSSYDNIFRGLVRCADCGRTLLIKVEHRRKRDNVIDQTFYTCTTYRKFGRRLCTPHIIEARTLWDTVLADIQKHARAAVSNRHAMVESIVSKMDGQLAADQSGLQREYAQLTKRSKEIDRLYIQLYEDLSRKIVPEQRFQMLSRHYDEEQKSIETRLTVLKAELSDTRAKVADVEQFVSDIGEYAGIKELSTKILNLLIDRIVVHEPETIDGERVQKLQIYYKFVGTI